MFNKYYYILNLLRNKSTYLLVGLICLGVGGYLYYEHYQIVNYGASTEATVLKTWRDKINHKKGEIPTYSYYADLVYKTESKQVLRLTRELDKQFWQTLSPGSTINIHYDRKNPTNFRMEFEEPTYALILMGVGCLLLIISIGPYFRRKMLSKDEVTKRVF